MPNALHNSRLRKSTVSKCQSVVPTAFWRAPLVASLFLDRQMSHVGITRSLPVGPAQLPVNRIRRLSAHLVSHQGAGRICDLRCLRRGRQCSVTQGSAALAAENRRAALRVMSLLNKRMRPRHIREPTVFCGTWDTAFWPGILHGDNRRALS